ncbi:diguanylate cyclase [Roseomonas sp. OT10]|uniref:diguanylate cyclase n=1 Tax=Roseomonas cutis TaxID=2897332 RepID=UPI001E54929C|nr:diguanylate cyclase [Roseomonas sp. OT10]UFN46953.1 diguanylate cyclase [Roseomonas sp. OT10]
MPEPASRPFRSMSFRAVAYAVIGCAALLGTEAWHAWNDRRAHLEEVETGTDNLARALAGRMGTTASLTDTLLAGLVDELQETGKGLGLRDRVDRRLTETMGPLEKNYVVVVLDQDGQVVASSLNQAPVGANESGQEFFRYHRDTPESGLHIALPVWSSFLGTWMVTFSRRLSDAQGRFAGVVMAGLRGDSLAKIHADLDVGEDGVIAGMNERGDALVLHPYDPADAAGGLKDGDWLRARMNPAAPGQAPDIGPSPDGERVYSVFRTPGYPLYVVIGASADRTLEKWRVSTASRAATTVLVAIVIGALGLRLASLARARQAAHRALRDSEAEFRLLAERSSEMIVRLGPDWRRRYVSPASQALLGKRPEVLLGRSAFDNVDPQDAAAVRERFEALLAGREEEGTFVYRMRRRDGRQIWVETLLRKVHHPTTGAQDGAVAMVRDITARKTAEAALETLASTDGLTGLTNRRGLDEALAREWSRAAREGRPLSLLLLDLDRFKVFNDTYGHPEGDECLRVAADAIARSLRRPGDLAARYGGEEFAAILPDTAAPDALQVAEAVRAAVEAAGMPHAGNPPWGVVTASLGVASAMPRPGGAEAGVAGLVAAADAALYEAKRGGRNRVAAAG